MQPAPYRARVVDAPADETPTAAAGAGSTGTRVVGGAPTDLSDGGIPGTGLSAVTERAYASDWEHFVAWCGELGEPALPASAATVGGFLLAHVCVGEGVRRGGHPRRGSASAAGCATSPAYSFATVTRWLSSINHRHVEAGLAPPGRHRHVRAVVAKLRAEIRAESRAEAVPPASGPAVAAERRSRSPRLLLALSQDDARVIVTAARGSATSWMARVAERRDSVIMLLGVGGGVGRSGLARLDVGDVDLRSHAVGEAHGLRLRWPARSGRAGDPVTRWLPVPDDHLVCAVCAYVRWCAVLDAWREGGRVGLIRLLRGEDEFDAHAVSVLTPSSAMPGTTRAGPVPPADDHAVDRDHGVGPGGPLLRGVHRSGGLSAGALTPQAIGAVVTRRAAATGIAVGSP